MLGLGLVWGLSALVICHVSKQTNDDESTVSVVEEGLAAYDRTGTYSDRREMSARAARLSSIL